MTTATETTETATARAAAILSAVELEDGRWAHYDDGMQRWYVVDAEDLAYYCACAANPDTASDAYSHWCAGTTSDEQPAWWSPEQTELAIEVGDVTEVYADCGGDPQPDDALEYYCSVVVTVQGSEYSVGVSVGARPSNHGSVRASGAGVRPYCTAWYEDASDWQSLPEDTRDLVKQALGEESLRLYEQAQGMAG